MMMVIKAKSDTNDNNLIESETRNPTKPITNSNLLRSSLSPTWIPISTSLNVKNSNQLTFNNKNSNNIVSTSIEQEDACIDDPNDLLLYLCEEVKEFFHSLKRNQDKEKFRIVWGYYFKYFYFFIK